ncbi:hypothetical protein A8709_20540 [Paenibacillus pectinilyticus]|uniref:SLH domain-containing protein n=1 Tax=Paenibacillus pectinilyticus TaxID=512399 RepID=A0A1C0ZYG2_9BACL|nr:S-layer homology domain-containing protein [Paenibacillus pectinilyticus]OCT13137.1 hypothetical protein A8709_20540 [Paenibacillus pectinilyticus]
MSESSSNMVRSNLKNKTHDIQGGEKKVMKKSLKVLATATLAFSMFASVAMADTTTTTPATTTTAATTTVKTSKDFTDLAGLDAALLAKVDALLAKGYMDGKTATTFDVTGNMTRAEAAKLVAKIFNLTVGTETTSSFKDVDGTDASQAWAIPFIEAAKKAGIIDGMTDTTFAPKDNVTIGQLATLLVKGFGKGSTVQTTTPWYQGYLDVAKAAGVDLGTDGAKLATRGDLVVGSYAADVAVSSLNAASISSVTATGAKKIEVKFNKAIDASKVTSITVARGTSAVTTAGVTWSDDKTTATIATSAKLFAGEYTVSVAGLTTAALTGKVTATDEKATKITISSDKAALDASDTTGKTVKVGYKVLNQYGEEITSITSLQASTSGTGVDIGTAGTAKITSATQWTLGQTVVLTLVQPDAGISATAALIVSPAAQVANVTVSKLYNAAGSTLSADTSDISAFELVVKAVDQYGSTISDTAALKQQVLVSVSNTTVASVKNLSSNKADWDTDTIDGSNVSVLKLAGTPTSGTTVVTLISASTGASTTFTVNVADGVVADNITFGSIDNTVALNDGSVNVPVTVTDKAGNEITDLTVLNSATKGIKIGGVAGGFTKVDGKVVYVYDFHATVTAAQTVVLTAITANNKVASKSITIKDNAVPAVITGFTSDVNPNILLASATTPVVAGTQNVTPGYLVVQDQYGRTMSSSAFTGNLGSTTYRVKVSEGNTATTSPVNLTGTALTSASDTSVVKAVYKGTETVSFSLEKWDANAVNPSPAPAGAWKAVSGSDFTPTFRGVAKSEFTSYTVNDITDVFKSTDYATAVTVSGVTADGKKVSLPVSLYNGSASLGSWDQATGKIDTSAVDFTVTGAPTLTTKAGTFTATINETGDVITKAYNAVTGAPSVKTLTVLKSVGGAATTNLELKNGTVGGTFSLATIGSLLSAVDQYGKSYVVSTANPLPTKSFISTAGVITFANGTSATPSLTISKLTNAGGSATPTISQNGTKDATITGVELGDSFTITVASGSGTTTVAVNIVQ